MTGFGTHHRGVLAGIGGGWRRAGQSLRLRLHSGLRQSGRAFGPVGFLGLRPRLVYRAFGPWIGGGFVECAGFAWVAFASHA